MSDNVVPDNIMTTENREWIFDDAIDPVDAEIRDRVVAEMSGVKVAPLTAERTAAHEQRLAERRAQDEIERETERWWQQQCREEQQRLVAEQNAREHHAKLAAARREQAAQRAREATAQAQQKAAEQAASHAAAVRQHLHRQAVQDSQAARLRAVQSTLDGLAASFQSALPQPARLADRVAELEAQLDPELERSPWHRLNWR
jgi:hypothetical protein